MERVNLLISDLDGTLLGDDRALSQFASWYWEAKNEFRLAYSSGRFVDSVYESINSSDLPQPDAIIGGVGTEILDVAEGHQIALWPPTVLGWNPHIVRAVCTSQSRLTPQPDNLSSYHKVSFYGTDLEQAFLDELVKELAGAAQRVTIVYSSNRDLDVLPADAHKGAAAAFLARNWDIDPQRVIVAGDSGNDVAMFTMGFRGVVVGNAHPELRALQGPLVYHAASPFAAGVLEGLMYWTGAACVSARSVRSSVDLSGDHGTRG